MKVVCIDESANRDSLPGLVKGNVYHVLDHTFFKDEVRNNAKMADGLYYKLVETNCWCHSSLFIKINETEIDEMELVNKVIEDCLRETEIL